MCDNEVDGPEDAVVREMTRQLLIGEDLCNYEVFSRTLHGSYGGRQVRGRLRNWCSYGNRMRSQRGEFEVTEPLL